MGGGGGGGGGGEGAVNSLYRVSFCIFLHVCTSF